jgi:hypothetical protein
MLAKAEKDNKILMQLINHHKKSAEVAKNKVNTYAQNLWKYYAPKHPLSDWVWAGSLLGALATTIVTLLPVV